MTYKQIDLGNGYVKHITYYDNDFIEEYIVLKNLLNGEYRIYPTEKNYMQYHGYWENGKMEGEQIEHHLIKKTNYEK